MAKFWAIIFVVGIVTIVAPYIWPEHHMVIEAIAVGAGILIALVWYIVLRIRRRRTL